MRPDMPTLLDTPSVNHWLESLGVERLLVVSPHLDDAILSLGELLRRVPSRTEVLTVFTASDPGEGLDWARLGGFQDSAEEHAARRLEDVRAMQHLGCAYRHAGLRSGQLNEAWLGQFLPQWLANAPSPNAKQLVLLPAGCGGNRPESGLAHFWRRLTRQPFGSMAHPEHVLVRDVFWAAMKQAPQLHIGFYAELPYAWRQTDAIIQAELGAMTGRMLKPIRVLPQVDQKLVAAEHYVSQARLILGESKTYRKRVLGRPECVFLVQGT